MENVTSNYDALHAAAEKATKGNWINVGAWVENESDDLKDICHCRPNGNENYEQALLDAAYIALANPDTILRLLLERRTALEAATRPAASCGARARMITEASTMTTADKSRADALTIRELIANDAYAMSFQTIGQYRTALLACVPRADVVGGVLSGDASECLMDVVSHHRDFVNACKVMHFESVNDDSDAYWEKQINVLNRMKVQAERALSEASADTVAAPADERAAFEAWRDKHAFNMQHHGLATEYAWSAWQARAAASQPAAGQEAILHEGMTPDQDDTYAEAELARAGDTK
ncbi:ead/Ea22-like family protein [Burkholderia sp. LA-2-3-30-S1-D2]|uniref:ead/Ea22-like family protein n=1 Tax=Burkholderia sp. LA-2-3-30-S1-D2 TaxID=1637862 RepID=UPI00075ABFCD|nr:ead/Ea22-like family protein [Burkholderia sp. LA-2-3-30-S1-D2]AOI94818.1 hypothetical protein WS66_03700 [Burkholderia sp. LA-2-3-30-S1-D2]KVE19975.1 hypothetical protein WS66_01640 [Burkholderia sp. LA-2-3-30-S1-D2]